ncbi:MAG: hypothetical protein AAGH15_03525 [Myxococcota bacterium]
MPALAAPSVIASAELSRTLEAPGAGGGTALLELESFESEPVALAYPLAPGESATLELRMR